MHPDTCKQTEVLMLGHWADTGGGLVGDWWGIGATQIFRSFLMARVAVWCLYL
jgi:hypothetical protein